MFLTFVGFATIVYILSWIGRLLYETFIHRADLTPYKSKQGSWALVTGCTSGIGEGFAHVLAEEGFNLVLVSRSLSKLQDLSTRLTEQYPSIRTKVVVSHAEREDSAGEIEVVARTIADLPLTIAVNNVGVSNGALVPHSEVEPKEIDHMLRVNCRYPVLLTQALLPVLRRQPRSVLINVASMAALIASPLIAAYAATKSFNFIFSESIRQELRMEEVEMEKQQRMTLAAVAKARLGKVDVLTLCPGFVVSAMTKIEQPTLEACSGRTCARAALNAIGMGWHGGYWFHHISLRLSLVIPQSLLHAALRAEMAKLRDKAKAKAKALAVQTQEQGNSTSNDKINTAADKKKQ